MFEDSFEKAEGAVELGRTSAGSSESSKEKDFKILPSIIGSPSMRLQILSSSSSSTVKSSL